MLAPPLKLLGGGGAWPPLAPPLPTPMFKHVLSIRKVVDIATRLVSRVSVYAFSNVLHLNRLFKYNLSFWER